MRSPAGRALLVAVVAILAGCGGAAAPSGGDVTGVSHPGTGGPPDLADVCMEGGAVVEQAFVGEVVAIDDGADVPWVTFAVEEWFTESIIGSVGLWVNEPQLAVGERWVVGASRYAAGDHDRAGTLLPCESRKATEDAVASFRQIHGDGFPRLDNDAVAARLAELTSAEQLWATNGPDSWTATISLRRADADLDRCGSMSVRVVVDAGEVVQARDVDRGCNVPLATAPIVSDLFDAARDQAELLAAPPSYHPELGYVEWFEAGPHMEPVVTGSVHDFVAEARPVADGDPSSDLAAARARWAAAGIVDYAMRVEEICFCGELVADVHVLDGEVQSTQVPEDRPNAAAPTTRTVEDLFDQVQRGLEYDRMSVRYDDEIGVPLLIILDPDTNTSDDELTIEVTDLTIG